MELRKFVTPEIITGNNARLLIERYLKHFGSNRPMIVTDKNLLQYFWFQDIIKEIEKHTKEYIIFDQVTSNPKDYEVMLGAAKFEKEQCDLIVAIGGGSSIDCAKGISIIAANGGQILDYEGVDEIHYPGAPLICIPTTAGASADVSQFAIICDSSNLVKKTIISKQVVPDLALLDCTPLTTMDAYLTACTGMDALTHAIEAYVSNANSPLTNIHALEAIKYINGNIVKAVSKDRSIEVLYQMMLGSLHAGLAFSNASLGLVHAMAHSLGGRFNFPHGECNSILLEHVVEYNFDCAQERYIDIAQVMNIQTENLTGNQIKKELINILKNIRSQLKIKEFYEVENLNNDIIEALVDDTLADPCLITNPKQVTRNEIFNLFKEVIHNKNG